MPTTSSNTRLGAVAIAIAAAAALGGCSKSGSDTAPPTAAASAPPATVAAAPASVAPAPAPTVVAQNDTRASRHDEARHERRQQRTEPLPPRADRDDGSAWQEPARPRESQRVAAAACANCGVVESFDQVKVAGQTNGTGAVAGSLGGAVIGNRIAGSNNRTLGGVVGAVGGGLIGNAIEKHERTTTAYDVHVRMEDGSLRTVRQATAPSLGAKVLVEADGLHSRS
jgi:outer membrane lipoprotein SlyB